MEYIIFDLEFNQGFDKKLNKTVSNEKCPFEIIQIGAIKLDSKFNIIDTFNSYVKPTIYKDIHPFISRMTNIKNSDFKYFNNPAGKSIGLQNAISILELDEKMSYHNALNDAYYTAKVFIKIYNPSIVPDIYLYTSIKPKTIRYSNKKRVDYDKLFDEFRKILNRELTKDEKKIINLAYNMGKTNQFTLENVKQRKNK